MLRVEDRELKKLVLPLLDVSPAYYITGAALLALVFWGVFVFAYQTIYDLGVTGMQRPAYWGVYMVNFIFFIGISHAGTLISAILRVTQAEWRRPITRIAEAITAFALIVGSLQILFDLGRPDRFLYVFFFGRTQSPLLWDAMSVTAYFLGSITYLYLPLIPDLAIMRDNLPDDAPAWRKRFYTFFSFGWRGNKSQWIRLEKAVAVMAILIIPIAVSVHTIISWILATTVQPGWHSTVFGPYFVVGAIFSGIGALFITMTIARRIFHLEDYLTIKTYNFLSYLLIAMTAIWFYFTFAEYMTLAAGQQRAEWPVLASKLWGMYMPSFWVMVWSMVAAFWILVIPRVIPKSFKSLPIFQPRMSLGAAIAAGVAMLIVISPIHSKVVTAMAAATSPSFDLQSLAWIAVFAGIAALILGTYWLKEHVIAGTVIASVFIVEGMWLERWNIVIPTMTHPRLIAFGMYTPSWIEWSLTLASFALFAFMFMVFFKLFPPISVWEVAEGRVVSEAKETIEMPMPPVTSPPRRGSFTFGARRGVPRS
ncbi:MAG: polysulfide reductase NrfD [Chloroflexi bacterium]|nr:polysulfide reductase NrfD [Chloroflexota bacterium]